MMKYREIALVSKSLVTNHRFLSKVSTSQAAWQEAPPESSDGRTAQIEEGEAVQEGG